MVKDKKVLCGGLGIGYTVSQKDGMWYAHKCGYPYIPVFGSFSKSKREALGWAAASMGLTYAEYIKARSKYGIR